MRFLITLLVVLTCLLSSCATAPQSETTYKNVYETFTYKDSNSSVKNTEIFLIAGSNASASFAQEIITQRKYWLTQGYSPTQIQCYYIIPDQEDFDKDQEQFLSLASDLKNCFLASIQNISRHLQEASNSKNVMIYISSHGTAPSEVILSFKKNNYHFKQEAVYLMDKYPLLNQYRLDLDSLDDGSASIMKMPKNL